LKLLVNSVLFVLLTTVTFAQNPGLISYHNFSSQFEIGLFEPVKTSSIVYLDYNRYEEPEIFFVEQTFSNRVYKKGNWSVDARFTYRRYRPFKEEATNEFRPTTVVSFQQSRLKYRIVHGFRFEQRFRETYSNRWRYKLDLNLNESTSKLFPLKWSNEFLYDFNSSRKNYENRFRFQLQQDVFGTGLRVSLEHRSKNLFSENKLQHLLVLRTDYSF